MSEKKTVCYQDVLKENFYCECGTWIYCPEMNEISKDSKGNEIVCIGKGCTKKDENGEIMECPECKKPYHLIK